MRTKTRMFTCAQEGAFRATLTVLPRQAPLSKPDSKEASAKKHRARHEKMNKHPIDPSAQNGSTLNLMDQISLSLAEHRHTQTIRLAKQLLRKDSEHIPALEALAEAQWQLTKLPELLQTLAKLICLNPADANYYRLRGMVKACLGQSGAALKEFQLARDKSASPQFKVEMERAMAALDSWQSRLVGELIEIDRAFAFDYLQNPDRAMSTKGFRFSWQEADSVVPKELEPQTTIPISSQSRVS